MEESQCQRVRVQEVGESSSQAIQPKQRFQMETLLVSQFQCVPTQKINNGSLVHIEQILILLYQPNLVTTEKLNILVEVSSNVGSSKHIPKILYHSCVG